MGDFPMYIATALFFILVVSTICLVDNPIEKSKEIRSGIRQSQYPDDAIADSTSIGLATGFFSYSQSQRSRE